MATESNVVHDQTSTASLRIPSLPVAREAANQNVRARVQYVSRRTGTTQTVEGRVTACYADENAGRGNYSLDVATDDGRTIFVHADLREVHSRTDACLTRLGRLEVIEPAGGSE